MSRPFSALFALVLLFGLLPAIYGAVDLSVWRYSIPSSTKVNIEAGFLNSDGIYTKLTSADLDIAAFSATDLANIRSMGGQIAYGWNYYGMTLPDLCNFYAGYGLYTYGQAFSVASGEFGIYGDRLWLVTVNQAPVITTQPAPKSVVAGNSVTFTVVATASPVPIYQWKFNGIAISGATSASHTISNATTGHAGSYTVTVSNARSSVTSVAATLTVLPPAPIIITPAQAGATVGESFEYPIAANGSPTSFNATGLPAGITVNASTGVITGSPTKTGTFNVTLSATNNTGTGTATLAVVVSPTVTVTTLAGTLGASGSSNSNGIAASFNGPTAVTTDSAGNLYIADKANHLIRKISATGVVTTLAGSAGAVGSLDGTGTNARFNSPAGITIDSSGNLFVTDMGNHTIRKITPNGLVSLFAGTTGVAGSTDNNVGTLARFNNPVGIVIDSSGNLYVADFQNQTIRKITPTGAVTTLAGSAGTSGSIDGTTATARFSLPYSLALDGQANLYVGDSGNHVIRKITLTSSSASVSTLVGQSGVSGSSDNLVMTSVTHGTFYTSLFSTIGGLAVDQAGFLYAADTSNHVIRKIDPSTGMVTTLAGLAGSAGSINGIGNTARFNYPNGLAIDSNGFVYVADQTSHAIRVLGFGPSVISHPQSQTITTGNSASFSVVATASPSPAYQWIKDNVAIAGANSATYSIANAQSENAGYYSVKLSNGSGTVTTNAATLTVNPVPNNSSTSSRSESSGGGGGAPSPLFLVLLALSAGSRILRPFKAKS